MVESRTAAQSRPQGPEAAEGVRPAQAPEGRVDGIGRAAVPGRGTYGRATRIRPLEVRDASERSPAAAQAQASAAGRRAGRGSGTGGGQGVATGSDDGDAGSIGERIVRRVAASVGQERWARHVGRDTMVTVAEGRVRVTVASDFQREYVVRHFTAALRRAAAAELRAERRGPEVAGDVPLEIVVEPSAFPKRDDSPGREAGAIDGIGASERGAAASTAAPAAPSRASSPRSASVEPRHRLDDFVVGECNRIAYTAACAIADGTAPPRFSPMFLHGPCGVGKTHLLQGMAVRASKRLGAGRVKYITAEAFTNDFVAAVRANKADAFRRAFRDVEILCIDDVHFFGSKQATQAELLHTLDTLGHAGRMVVLAGDESPRDIRMMAESLRSRFLSGAVIQVDAPDDATRVELVRRLSASRGLALDDGAVSLLAERAGRPLPGGSSASVRDIQGLLTRVEAAHRLILGGDRGGAGVIDRSMVARALGLTSVGGGESRRPVPIALILERVCRSLRVDASDLMGRGRHARVVLARALVTYLARRLTTMSYPEIARSMNRPNHSTVITAFNRVTRQMSEGETVAGGSDMVDVTIKSLAERLEREVVSVGG